MLSLILGVGLVGISVTGSINITQGTYAAASKVLKKVIHLNAQETDVLSLPVSVAADAPSTARTLNDGSTATTSGETTTVTAAPTTVLTPTPIVTATPSSTFVSYTIISSKPSSFTTGAGSIPKSSIAIARALSYVGNAGAACSDGFCSELCDHLAGVVWGYNTASGYASAETHWETAVSQGIAHKDDKNPPLGALLFYKGGTLGHVATYVGEGMVVSNVNVGSTSNVYLVSADFFGMPYLGWAPPVFFGAAPGSAL